MAASRTLARAGAGAPRLAIPGGELLGVAVLALVLRLLHVQLTARVHVADDAVFFLEHARRFLGAWEAAGTPGFGAALREAIDHASLQGIVYPLFQSLVYRLGGGVEQGPLLLAQALLGAATVWLTALTASRAFGRPAGRVAGVLAALYAPFVLTSGLLLAEGLLLAIQALALLLLVRGVTGERRLNLLWGGLATGLLMLRPAFQYAGPILGLAIVGAGFAVTTGPFGTRLRHGLKLLAPFVGGVLLVALPWLTMNGLVFGSPVWSRTGDAWQQVYWGIYPPNRGWWPPDSPVPPKFGVESLPGARSAGLDIRTRDLDYLEAAVQQVQATPLQALATEVNKLYQGYLHPFNNYAETPPLTGPLAVPLHRALAFAALAGMVVAWRRPAPSLILGAALAAFGLPFLVSHIDVRYTVPPAQVGMLFAGAGMAAALRGLRAGGAWRDGAFAVGLPFGAWALGVPILTALLPGLAPWRAHLLHTVLMAGAFVAAAWLGGRLLARAVADGLARKVTATGVAAGIALAAVYGVQALYDGDWHEWSTLVGPEGVRQTFFLPAGWTAPPGSRAELRLYLQGSPTPNYEPVVWVNGQVAGRLGRAFTDAGPLRFDQRLMDSASRQGKLRSDVPQWYAVPLAAPPSGGSEVVVELTREMPPGDDVKSTGVAEAWIRVWGDYPLRGPRRYEGPAVHSRILGADNAFHKLVASGHPMLWRRAPLDSVRAEGARSADSPWSRDGTRHEVERWQTDDLSDSAGRQTGEYRIRLLILAPNGDLLALF